MSHRRDDGFTLLELSIVLALLVVVGAITVSMLLAVQRVTREVGGRADASTELRLLLDDTFADLATARGPLRCVAPAAGLALADCRQVSEVGTPLVAASPTGVCYLSRRPDPTRSGAGTSLTATPWKACVRSTGSSLVLDRYAPIGETDPSYPPAPTTSRVLGATTTAQPFAFVDTDGAAVAPTDLPSRLDAVAVVTLTAQVTYPDAQAALRTRTLSVTAGLRANRYEREGTWTGDRTLGGTP
jgi:prepilin-type N-terminal cleavage/methylation domain-containing protein